MVISNYFKMDEIMKRITTYTIAWTISMLLVLAVVSCTKDESAVKSSENAPSKGLIKVTGETSGQPLKTTLNGLVTEWIASTDRVGVYSPEARTATGGGGTAIVNAEFVAASTGAVSDFSGTMYWGAANTLHHFYSYYPLNMSYSGESTLVPVSLAALQTQAAANSTYQIGGLDFMIATPVAVTSPSNTNSVGTAVNFHYNHLFTLLDFQVTGTGSLNQVRLSALGPLAFATGNIDITQTTPAANVDYNYTAQSDIATDIVVSLTSAATLSSTPTHVYMMVAPGVPPGQLMINMEIGGVWKYIIKNSAPVGGFERGKCYTVTVDASTALDLPIYPESSTPAILAAGVWWAPVNCGYMPSTRIHGQVFQFNRKSGQNNGEAPAPTITVGPVSVTTGNDPANDNTFYTSVFANNYDWCTPQASGWDQTNYNPCPAGWRLPTNAEFEALNNIGSAWTSSGGPDNLPGRWIGGDYSGTHAGSVFFSASGYRLNSNGNTSQRNTSGVYWSSDVYSIGGYALAVTSSLYATVQYYRADGLSVRCVKQ
jgi:uncharacterized protein (TIGR02145 family)